MSEGTASALYEYSATQPDELSISKEESLEVLVKHKDDWWLVRNAQGQEGLIPGNYVYEESGVVRTKETPAYLPPGWESAIDPESHERYYYNTGTGAVQWNSPSNVPSSSSPVQESMVDHEKSVENAEPVMTGQDLAEFKKLREEADAKLAALKQVLSYQENIHLLEGKANQPNISAMEPRMPEGAPRFGLSGRSKKPSQRVVAQSKKGDGGDGPSNSNLRLDPLSLKAIGKIIDDKMEDRDDKLLGQVKAMVSSPEQGSPLGESFGRHATFQSSAETASSLPQVQPRHLTKTGGDSPPRPSRIPPGPREPWVSPNTHNATGIRKPLSTQASAVRSRRDGDNGVKGSDGLRYPQCRSIVYAPTMTEKADGVGLDESVDTSKPISQLQLNHVYAYGGDSSRHGTSIKGKNVMFLTDDKIMFPAGALVVVMDMRDGEQGFFSGHSDEVTCLTIHPDRVVAASGQIGKGGKILVWDSTLVKSGSRTFSASVELDMKVGTKGVCGLNFSGDGRFLIALGMDESHSMVVFDWAQGAVVATAKVGHSDVHQMGFNPFLFAAIDRIDELKLPVTPREGDDNAESCCYTLVSVGGRQVKFWTLRRVLEKSSDSFVKESGFKGRKIAAPKKKQQFSVKYALEGNAGIFPKSGTAVPEILCFACINDGTGGASTGNRSYVPPQSRILTGTSTGAVYIWQQLEDPQNDHTLTDYSWQPRGRLLSVVSDVHESPIVDMDYTGSYWFMEDEGGEYVSNPERLVTVGKDCVANVWRFDRESADKPLPFDHVSTVNIGYSESNIGAPRCISWNLDGTSIVAGTTGNALLQLLGDGLVSNKAIMAPNGGDLSGAGGLQPHVYVQPLMRSHRGKVTRVAKHPNKPIFATISNDRTVRLWNSDSKKQISLTRLAERASSVAFTPDGMGLALGSESGELIVISYTALSEAGGGSDTQSPHSSFAGATSGVQIEKQWQVVFRRHVAAKTHIKPSPDADKDAGDDGDDGDDGEEESKDKDRYEVNTKKSEVVELKYSPEGDTLAIACKDNLIHLLSVRDGYRRIAVCRGHSSYVRTMDFSEDGAILQAADTVRELLFWDVVSGKQIHNAASVRNVAWHSWTCGLGWPVRGVFNGSGGTAVDADVHAVCRSRSRDLVVSGGSSSTAGGLQNCVKLFRFPCIDRATPAMYGGHAASVTDVVFMASDQQVVSVGGSDSTVFVWNVAR